jgi:carbonic anhydrase
MEIKEIIQRLKDGNKRFISDKSEGKFRDSIRRDLLTSGQSPFAAILGCADSRVVPEILFDVGLGEIFTVRVAGNIANIASIASIEFAVTVLKVKVVIVQGHSNCGAVSAAKEGGNLGYNLNLLLTHIKPAIEQASSKDITDVIKKNAELNAEELVARSALLKEAVENGKVKIVPTFYNLESGEVELLNE